MTKLKLIKASYLPMGHHWSGELGPEPVLQALAGGSVLKCLALSLMSFASGWETQQCSQTHQTYLVALRNYHDNVIVDRLKKKNFPSICAPMHKSRFGSLR